MCNLKSTLDRAESALARGDFEDSIRAASFLVDAGEPWRLDGLARRAIALENWIDGPDNRLALATADWLKIIEIAPAAVSFIGLARVQLKMGERDSALSNLRKAEKLGAKSDAWLGLAHLFRTTSPLDIKKAQQYYMRAALLGRVNAMRGYVDTAFELDQPYLAAAMTLFGLLTAPFFALTIGHRRHSSF